MYTLKMNNGISLSAMSLQGKRSQQQDYFTSVQLPDRTIAIVCDGMGGMNGGEIASRKAAEMLMDDLQTVGETDDMYAFFQEELIRLDDAIFALRDETGTRIGAGTTLVSIMIFQNRLYWFSVGDSKFYYKRQKDFVCVTREHNYAMLLEEQKKVNAIDEREYQAGKKRGEELISYLGLGVAQLFDGNCKPFIIEKGDRILLCTDGLYRTVSEEEICSIMSQSGTTERICKFLENAVGAKNKSNQDNATWIVLQKIGD